MKLGLAGNLSRLMINSPITPVLLMTTFVLGIISLYSMPREEEPQISVPIVDIFVTADGLKAEDGIELITKPLESIIKGIDGVEHVYSKTMDDEVIATARFHVGHDEDQAFLKIQENIHAHLNEIPYGIPMPLIVSRGINDVPVLVVTLSAKKDFADKWDDNKMFEIAEELKHELEKTKDVRGSFIVGGRANQFRIEPVPEKLLLYGITLDQVANKITNANRSFHAGLIRHQHNSIMLLAGKTLQTIEEVGHLLITAYDGRPVYLKDIAEIKLDSQIKEQRVWHLYENTADLTVAPAVCLAISKRKGSNATLVVNQILSRLKSLEAEFIPESLELFVTRNYGATALEKSNSLLFSLGMVTLIIVAVITLVIGWKEGLVVLIIIPSTIFLTLFFSWQLGYTLNRVSLFALIFSIGILVDDAIVITENIVRHWQGKVKNTAKDTLQAIAEVGNPTIMANLTILAALLPMLFVSGLMGPYMSPIPVNASIAVILSLILALIFVPWLLSRLKQNTPDNKHEYVLANSMFYKVYTKVVAPIIKSKRNSMLILVVTFILILLSCALFISKSVRVKMLPYDNKSEIQVLLDMPVNTTLEATERTLMQLAQELKDIPEIKYLDLFAGTAAPFNFNGLVRHYYLRQSPELGELQLTLQGKSSRSKQSHAIAIDIRKKLQNLSLPKGAVIQIVEVPPGPPTLATMQAEIYGPDAKTRRELATQVKTIFAKVPFIVDIHDSFKQPAKKIRLLINNENLEFYQVEEKVVFDTIRMLFQGLQLGYSHRGENTNPIEIRLQLPKNKLTLGEQLLSTPVPSKTGFVELGNVTEIAQEYASYPLYRHNGKFTELVMAELAGTFEAPIYGMQAVHQQLKNLGLKIKFTGQPNQEKYPALLWDGEWEITYVTFRDLGGAFIVALLGIYLLLVMQFSNFIIPLLILTPIPLTLIGIIPGHYLLDAHFTATSMIGFISLSGIIVRNSLLLVEFIKTKLAAGEPLNNALLTAGATRFRPIFLTAFTAMIGALFMLTDPIFQGLAISLLFGLAASTILTMLVVPALYIVLEKQLQNTN